MTLPSCIVEEGKRALEEEEAQIEAAVRTGGDGANVDLATLLKGTSSGFTKPFSQNLVQKTLEIVLVLRRHNPSFAMEFVRGDTSFFDRPCEGSLPQSPASHDEDHSEPRRINCGQKLLKLQFGIPHEHNIVVNSSRCRSGCTCLSPLALLPLLLLVDFVLEIPDGGQLIITRVHPQCYEEEDIGSRGRETMQEV